MRTLHIHSPAEKFHSAEMRNVSCEFLNIGISLKLYVVNMMIKQTCTELDQTNSHPSGVQEVLWQGKK